MGLCYLGRQALFQLGEALSVWWYSDQQNLYLVLLSKYEAIPYQAPFQVLSEERPPAWEPSG